MRFKRISACFLILTTAFTFAACKKKDNGFNVKKTASLDDPSYSYDISGEYAGDFKGSTNDENRFFRTHKDLIRNDDGTLTCLPAKSKAALNFFFCREDKRETDSRYAVKGDTFYLEYSIKDNNGSVMTADGVDPVAYFVAAETEGRNFAFGPFVKDGKMGLKVAVWDGIYESWHSFKYATDYAPDLTRNDLKIRCIYKDRRYYACFNDEYVTAITADTPATWEQSAGDLKTLIGRNMFREGNGRYFGVATREKSTKIDDYYRTIEKSEVESKFEEFKKIAAATRKVTVENCDEGTLKAAETSPVYGDTTAVYIRPSDGYYLNKVLVAREGKKEADEVSEACVRQPDGSYLYSLTDIKENVKVSAEFVKKGKTYKVSGTVKYPEALYGYDVQGSDEVVIRSGVFTESISKGVKDFEIELPESPDGREITVESKFYGSTRKTVASLTADTSLGEIDFYVPKFLSDDLISERNADGSIVVKKASDSATLFAQADGQPLRASGDFVVETKAGRNGKVSNYFDTGAIYLKRIDKVGVKLCTFVKKDKSGTVTDKDNVYMTFSYWDSKKPNGKGGLGAMREYSYKFPYNNGGDPEKPVPVTIAFLNGRAKDDKLLTDKNGTYYKGVTVIDDSDDGKDGKEYETEKVHTCGVMMISVGEGENRATRIIDINTKADFGTEKGQTLPFWILETDVQRTLGIIAPDADARFVSVAHALGEKYALNAIKTLAGTVVGESSGQSEDSASACSVEFDSNGGTAVAKVTVKRGEKLSEPVNPSKSTLLTQYFFDGWYLDGKRWDFKSDVVTSDMKLVARWKTEGNYTVGFKPKR